MDDFALMLLSRHESMKSTKSKPAPETDFQNSPVPVVTPESNETNLKVSLFSKNTEGEHIEINQDDFSMLSMQPKDH